MHRQQLRPISRRRWSGGERNAERKWWRCLRTRVRRTRRWQPYCICASAGDSDHVLSRNEGGSIECHEVTRTFRRLASDRATVTLDAELGQETIHTTLGHPFFGATRGWTPVRELSVGDLLKGIDDTKRSVVT